MNAGPDIFLLGYGVDDSLQLTVETQRVLTRIGRAFTLGLPLNLRRLLKSQRVECVELDGSFAPGRPFSECYLEVAEVLLTGAQKDPPIVFLTHGSPLFLNSLNRFVVLQARDRGVTVRALPGVSLVDAIVNELGLDVGAFGLQLFDARRLLARSQPVDPTVPLIVLQVGAITADAVGDVAPDRSGVNSLGAYLSRVYPAEHAVTLVNFGPRAGRSTVPLQRFENLLPDVMPTSSLFLDAVRGSKLARGGNR